MTRDGRSETEYAELLGSGSEGLALFLDAMAKFDAEFCEAMAKNQDFTIRLEIHGNQGQLLHARCHSDGFRRPRGAEKKISAKKRQ